MGPGFSSLEMRTLVSMAINTRGAVVMLSVFGLLAVSNFVVMSDCDHFWDVDTISGQTEIEWNSIEETTLIDFNALRGKKVLLLVHGFNNDSQTSLQKTASAHFLLLWLVALEQAKEDGYASR